jgi:hypothetical protein
MGNDERAKVDDILVQYSVVAHRVDTITGAQASHWARRLQMFCLDIRPLKSFMYLVSESYLREGENFEEM